MPHFPKPFFKKSRSLWYVEVDRRQISLGPDRQEAFRRYHELMREPARRQVDSRSLVAVIDAFLEWVQKHLSPDTYEWYRYRLQRLAQKHPSLTTQELKPFHVQQWVDGYSELSKTSRRNYLRTIKRCLKWAKRQGYLDHNPLDELELPGQERREVIVTQEQFDLILANIPDPNFRDLVITTWETGCRPQESLIVEARHVDLKHRRWVFPSQEAKGKRQPRAVYLNDVAFEITKKLLEQYQDGPLFRNQRGVAWTPDAVNCAFARVRTRIANRQCHGFVIDDEDIEVLIRSLKSTRKVKGVIVKKSDADLRQEAMRKLRHRAAIAAVPSLSLYALRHAWATRALQSGLDGLTVAILMGHSDPSTLARVYQHLSHNPQHLLTQANKVQC